MRCLVVGADRLGTKEEFFAASFGITDILHWDGRKKKPARMPQVDVVYVLTGFVNHQLAGWVKREAKKRGIKVVYLKRGISELMQTA